MSQYLGFWIRRNKNVQVKCHNSRVMADGTELLTICFRNGHVKSMFVNQLLEEFINFDDLLSEITEGSRWVDTSTKIQIEIDEVKVRAAAVFYTIEGVPKEYSKAGMNIQNFKSHFKPVLIPIKESK